MKVVAVQYKAERADRARSLRAVAALADSAAPGADLVVLPEMAITGYAFAGADAVRAVAEGPRGDTFAALSPIARSRRAFVVCGFPEIAGDRLFNSAMVIDPTGELAFVYRKTLLFDADVPWATPGDSGYRAFDSEHGRFGVGICMDLNDDRFVDWVAAERVPTIAFPTNWIDEGENVWWYWRERLLGLRTSLVAANSWGEDGELRFTGESAILVDGKVVAHAPYVGDVAIAATVPG